MLTGELLQRGSTKDRNTMALPTIWAGYRQLGKVWERMAARGDGCLPQAMEDNLLVATLLRSSHARVDYSAPAGHPQDAFTEGPLAGKGRHTKRNESN